MIFVKNFTPAHFQNFKNLPKKTRKSQHFKPYISHFWRFNSLIGNISQVSYISALFTHVRWVNIVCYSQKLNHNISIGPKTDPQSELLPE